METTTALEPAARQPTPNLAVLLPSYGAPATPGRLAADEARIKHLWDYDWLTFGPGKYHLLDTPTAYWDVPPDGRRGYSPLMCSRGLYEQLDWLGYDWALVYQPDAIVFSDQLAYFTGLDYDYIGAPHADQDNYPRGGNGGLSLRRVSAFLAALKGTSQWIDIESYWRHVGGNEDIYWSTHPLIKQAPLQISYRFAWEADPTWWWLANKRRIPMGAHGWERHSPEFWDNLGGVRTLAGLGPSDRRT